MKKAAVTPPFLFHSVQDHPRIFHEYSNADARCLFIRGRIRGWLTTPTISFRFSRNHLFQRHLQRLRQRGQDVRASFAFACLDLREVGLADSHRVGG